MIIAIIRSAKKTGIRARQTPVNEGGMVNLKNEMNLKGAILPLSGLATIL